jgi:hypothetical protein
MVDNHGWNGMETGTGDLDALIREEKRLTSVESHSEAWAEGISAGIEPEIIAEAALATAIEEFLRVGSDSAVLAMMDRIREKVVNGDFHADAVRH